MASIMVNRIWLNRLRGLVGEHLLSDMWSVCHDIFIANIQINPISLGPRRRIYPLIPY